MSWTRSPEHLSSRRAVTHSEMHWDVSFLASKLIQTCKIKYYSEENSILCTPESDISDWFWGRCMYILSSIMADLTPWSRVIHGTWELLTYFKYYSPFMELDPLPCLLRPIIGSYPEPEESNHHTLFKIIRVVQQFIHGQIYW